MSHLIAEEWVCHAKLSPDTWYHAHVTDPYIREKTTSEASKGTGKNFQLRKRLPALLTHC